MGQLIKKDVVGGCCLVLLGLFFAIGAFGYGFGSPTRMGPGFFPGSLGILAILLGIAIAAKGLKTSGELPPVHWRSLASVVVGVSVFALLIEHAGIIPAAFLAILVFSLGNRNPGRPIIVVSLAIAVAVIGWLIFVVGFGLPAPGIRGLL
jgi:hypothetical protein